MTIENLNAYNSMAPETEEEFVYRYAELLVDNASIDDHNNLAEDIRKHLPHDLGDDETKLLKREIGNTHPSLYLFAASAYLSKNHCFRLSGYKTNASFPNWKK